MGSLSSTDEIDVHTQPIAWKPSLLEEGAHGRRGCSPPWLLLSAWCLVVGRYTEADPIICDVVNHAAYAASIEGFEFPSMHRRMLSIARRNKTKFGDILAHPGESMQDASDTASPHTAVLLGAMAEADASMSLLGQYDCSLIVDDPLNPTTISVISRPSPGTWGKAEAQALACTLEQTVQQLLLRPESLLRDLDLFTSRDHEILARSNRKAPRDAPDESIVDSIWQHSVTEPDKPAVIAWDGTLTYAELRHAACRLALVLSEAGVGAETMVPVLFDKSVGAIVAELAILQAGGAFVPLDQAQPDDRLQGIIDQIRPPVALTTPSAVARLEPWVKQVIPVDVNDLQSLHGSVEPCLAPVRGEAMAYVLFTSGSTGKPKGCVVSHGALADVRKHTDALHIRPESRVLQFASYSFGVSLIEIYCTLSAGGTLCIPSEGDRLNNLTEFLQTQQISWAILTPSTALSIDPECVGATLQTLVLAGEAMTSHHHHAWAHRVELIQAYGLTEWAGICCVSRPLDNTSDIQVIGSPPTANIWLVDPDDCTKLAPVGTVAELAIEGPSLYRGYLHRPDQTEAAYIRHPSWRTGLSHTHSSRLYRTGDLVQLQPNGDIRYIARKDLQLKVRGKRLELNEVEYQIRRLWQGIERVIADGVQPADVAESPLLAAFIFSPKYVSEKDDCPQSLGGSPFIASPAGDFQRDVQDLRDSLANVLPEHMLPTFYIPLTHIPLTITGKVDRRLLRHTAGALTRSQLDALQFSRVKIVRPRTVIEKTLHEAVACTLNRDAEQFGVHEEFLRLGGDSIKAMRLANLSKSKGLRLTVARILQEKTIARMATTIREIDQKGGHSRSQEQESRRPSAIEQPRIELERLHATHLAKRGINLDEVERFFPCTPIQEGIILSQARRPELYHMRFVWEIRHRSAKSIDLTRLQWAWQRLSEIHPMLRTILVEGSGLSEMLATQVVLKSPLPAAVVVYCVSEKDLDAVEMDDSDPGRQRPQLLLCHCEKSEAVYGVLHISHALVDAMSMSVMQRDLSALYDGDIRDPREDYSAYAAYIQTIPKDASLSFWQRYLGALEPCLFPLLNDKANSQAPASASLRRIDVDVGDPAQFTRFSETSGITLASVFKLAWSCVLHAFTGASTVAFGYMTAGRDVPVEDVEDLVGPFIDMMICRVDVEGQREQSLLQMVTQIQAEFIEALPHQRAPIQDIMHGLGLSGEPLFNTTMTFPPQAADPDAAGRTLSIEEQERNDPTEYDIVVEAAIRDHGINATLKYWPSCLSDEQAADVASTFSTVLRHIVEQPDQLFGQIQLLGERDMLKLASWNGQVPHGVSRRVEDLISETCQEYPDKVAIDSWDGQLTYRQLDQLACKLAHVLAGRGIGPGEFVPLCFAKCRWTPVAVLGVIKTGAAFALLDPSHPVERLLEICKSLNPKLVLCSDENASLAHTLAPSRIVVSGNTTAWKSMLKTGVGHGDHCMARRLNPSQPLYAVFTSGSTGRPKGVIMEHESFCTAGLNFSKKLSLSCESRVFQFSGYAFDVSVSDSLMPLLVGATICIPSESDRRDRLSEAMEEMRATWMETTPSVARTLDPERLSSLKTLVLAGEALLPSDVAVWAGRLELHNLYGPAECAIGVTVQPVTGHDSDSTAIGWAIDGAATWVADPSRTSERLMPIGAAGELVVEGPIVARGYRNLPEGSSSPFLHKAAWLDRFRPMTQRTRLYRTGDLVRYDAHGSLRYIGRKDGQVKLRGQRIELGEIESRINSLWPGSCETVAEVVTPSEPDSRPMLVAFVCQSSVSESGRSQGNRGPDDILDMQSQVDPEFLSRTAQVTLGLEQTTPSYMVPSLFIPLHRIPLGQTQKTDRRLLRQLVAQLPRAEVQRLALLGTTHRPVHTPTEHGLQDLFAQVLGMPSAQVTGDSHFFRIGGDSIVAMKLVALGRAHGLALSVADLFQHPQLSALATHLDEKKSEECTASALPVAPFSMIPEAHLDSVRQTAIEQTGLLADEIEDIYPCTALQEGLLALTAQAQEKYVGHLSYRIDRGVDVDRLCAAWQQTHDAHPILRSRVVVTDSNGAWQVVQRPSPIKWWSAVSVEQYLLESRSEKMGPGQPLARFAVIDPPASVSPATREMVPRSFVITLHHALYDGWTIQLLLRQLEAAYHGEDLRPRPFAPFIRYLEEHDNSAGEKFWTSVFDGLQAPVFPPLPAGFQGRPNPSQLVDRTIDLGEAGESASITSGATLSNMIRLAWGMVVSHYTDSDDVVFGITVTGRSANVPGITDMTGPTIATHPFRIQIDGQENVAEAVDKVQSLATRAMPHEQVGLQQLRKMSADTKLACDFQSHITVQQSAEDSPDGLLIQDYAAGDYKDFASYAWVLVCELPRNGIREVKAMANFDPNVLSRAQATRLLNQFAHVLRQVCLSAQKPLHQIEMASEEDVQQLQFWNSFVPLAYQRTVHELVLEQDIDSIRRERPAISSTERCLTFGELCNLSRMVASELLSRGLRQGSMVPLCFEKSVWPVVAMLGVLRAGGVVVNIDPALPEDRVRQMLEDTTPSILLAGVNTLSFLRRCAPSGADVLAVPTTMDGPVAVSFPTVRPTDPAFVVFTSGSTGKPKGILIEHANLATTLRAHASCMNVQPDTRALHFAAYAFDISIYEIFNTLVTGGCICIPSESERLSRLADFIREQQVNWAIFTPSAVSVLQPADVPSLKTIVLAGEPVTHENVSTWGSHVMLVNGYGPAEATVFAAAGRIPGQQGTWKTGTIGPVQGACGWVTVADDCDRLAPLGAVGELLIEGPIVAREYVNRPDETKAGFIDPPAWLRRLRPEGCGRLYRSRDLVQLDDDGWIRFIGRKDTQVKLRGQRIELGEVERHIRTQWPDAHEIVAEGVKRRGPSDGDSFSSVLVAFVQPHIIAVTPEQNREILAPRTEAFSERASILLAHLQSTLPPYMVPAVIFPLGHVPLTRSGKMDRRRLRDEAAEWNTSVWECHASQEPSSTTAKDQPQTDPERRLQSLWATVLSVPPESVGRDDSFFTLGGESIAAMKLAALATRQQLDITVAQIFAFPRLKDMAEEVATTPSQAAPWTPVPAEELPFSLLGLDGDAAREAIIVAAESQCQIPRTEIEDVYPCTPLQEGLIALTVKQPGTYRATMEFECPEEIDLDRYQKAWERVAQAHPILRTRIIQTESHGCLQVVLKTASIQCLQSVNPEQFGLGVPLLQLAKSDTPPASRLLVCMHHTIYDGWSLPLLLAEVERAWRGEGLHPHAFRPLIAHQIASHEPAVEYWKNQLAGAEDAVVAFPTVPSGLYTPNPDRSMHKTLSLAQKGAGHAGEARWTVATRLRLAWAMTVMHYTCNDDVVFGITTSGRAVSVPGIEGIIGPTITTAPARVRGMKQMSIEAALQLVQNSSLEAMAHEHLGLQEIRGLTDSTAAASAFQTLMVIQPESKVTTKQTGHALFERQLQSDHTGVINTYPLLLVCEAGSQFVTLEAVYDPRVLPEQQLERMLRQLEYVFMNLLEFSPDTPIRDLPVLNTTDTMDLARWTGSPLAATVQVPVHVLIEETASLQPNAEAVHAWDGRLTYQDLNLRASYLSSLLRFRGVASGMYVPLLFEKSYLTVVAQLAIMKAGAAFVLLDASSPIQRLQSICAESGARFILASATQCPTASSLCRDVFVVTADVLDQYHSSSLPVAHHTVQPTDPAYAVFTSGSTGKPKGVIIDHAALTHGVQSHVPVVKLDRSSRVLQFAGYTFDASIMDHISTLVAGGCICIPSEEDRRDKLAAVIRELGVNFACLTTSVIRTLTPLEVPNLATLLSAGEPMGQDIIDVWAASTVLINGYGPAECTIMSSGQNQIDPTTDPRDIGHLCGAHCWIVDPDDPANVLPIGAVGELILEGPLVGQGYLNDAARTAAAFLQQMPGKWKDIQSHAGHTANGVNGLTPTSRLYRTGDLAQYGPDGRLYYHGRRDRQVKLRGQRIELADIEYHILACFTARNETRDVIVELVTPETRAPFLAAFSASRMLADGSTDETLAIDDAPSIRRLVVEVDRELESLLPPHMLPSVHLAVSHIPLNRSGKADRQQLTKLATTISLDALIRAGSDHDAESHKPTTDIQVRLQAIWARVLNVPVEHIGILDNFFRVGGDSISAMQVATQSAAAGLTVRAVDLFKYKTIAELAAFVSARPHAPAASMQPKAGSGVQRGQWVKPSPIQQFFFGLSPEIHNHFNQSFFLRCQRPVSCDTVERALVHIVEIHPMLRARYRQEPSGQWMQTIPVESERGFLLNDHVVSGHDEMTRIAAASQRSLDFQHGPVFAVDLLQVHGTPQQYIFLTAHHLVMDLLSWRVILEDLEDLLLGNSLLMSEAIPFLDWCVRQEAYAVEHLPPTVAFPGPGLDKLLDGQSTKDYWHLDSRSNTFGEVQIFDLKIDQVTTGSILGSANSAMRTQPVEIIQAAIHHAFETTFTDRPAPLIFTEGHGREPWDPEIDLSRTVGWFTSIWPTAVDISSSHSLIDTICRVKDARRQTPANGWSYFTSRFLHPEGQVLAGPNRPMEILFKYLGVCHQLERPDSLFVQEQPLGSEARDIGDMVPRFALIDISAYVSNGCLGLKFLVNPHMEHQDRIKDWISLTKLRIEEAATDLVSLEPRLTLTECSLMKELSYERLDAFLADLLPRTGVSARDIAHLYPCSPMQRGILMAQARNPDRYQSSLSWRISSTDSNRPIDISTVRRAWLQVVARHDMLRTIFVDCRGDGLLDQLVLTEMTPTISIGDKQEQVVESVQANIDLNPQHRVTLSEGPEGGAVLFQLDINHALIDGTSMSVIKCELALACAGELSTTSPATSSYQSYIQYLQSKDNGEAQKYWHSYLQGGEPCVFPSLRMSDAETAPREKDYTARLCQKLDLDSFCDEHGLSITVICHLAWALVLRDYTSQESVSFGFVVSGRDVPVSDVQITVGPFINTLVGSISGCPSQTVLAALGDYQQRFFSSLEHQHYPVADIHLGPGRSAAGLFNTLISIQMDGSDARDAETSSPQIPCIEELGGKGLTEYPLSLGIGVQEGDIVVSMGYWTSFFSEEQAESIAFAFRQALSTIIQCPTASIGDISLAGPEDRAQICHWNQMTPISTNRERIDDLIQQRCNAQPSEPAICAWDGSMTYKDLDDLSSRIALQLQRQSDFGPEKFIPLCFEKSMWTVVAMLAVLKTGSAFVLLDPSNPLPRLQHICADIEASLVLAGQGAISVAQSLGVPAQVLSPETTAELIGEQASSVSLRSPDKTPQNAAYVIFTSGSTGTPKGVVISHESFCCAAHAQRDGFGLSSSSRVLQFASYAFDICMMDMLTTLIAGGCICIPSDEDRRDRLGHASEALLANWACLTPSVARVLSPEDIPSMQTLVLAGEATAPSDISMWSHLNLKIGYGPSECAVTCMCQASPAEASHSTNIGFGSGAYAWIVDPMGSERLLPVGAVGELVIEGPLVGRGYLGRPEQTARSFIGVPSWRRSLALEMQPMRMYRTGDLVQYTADGSIVYRGRKDGQVKVRGQRVELGEIEVQVQQAFRQARQVIVEVIPAGDGHQNPFICAFVWQSSSDSTEQSDLFLPPTEQFWADIAEAELALAERLPRYMLPDSFVPLSSPPVNKSGKTDRKLLVQAASSLSRTALSAYHGIAAVVKQTPRTAVEHKVRELVAGVLNLVPDAVGMDEDFFRIGGDSVTAMMLAGAARRESLPLSVPDIFKRPRLGDMAHHAEQSAEKAVADAVDCLPGSLVGLSEAGPATYTSTVDRLACSYGLNAEDIMDILPTTSFQRDCLSPPESKYCLLNIPGPVALDRLQRAVDTVVQKYSILRTVFVPLQDTMVQVPLHQASIPVRHLQTSKSQLTAYTENLARADSLVSVPNGTLYFQVWLVSADDDIHHAVLLRISHAQYDGLSLPRLFFDLSAAYTGRSVDPAPDYADYIVHRHRHMTTTPSLEFWREYLAGSSITELSLPTASRPADTTVDLEQDIPMPALPDGITMATLHKAAWALVLARHTHTSDLVFGQVVNGRGLALNGVEDILGACVHVVPVRVRINDSWRVYDLLQDVQTSHIRALPYETVDMEDLVEHCTDWTRDTRLQTVAQYQNVPLNPQFQFAGVNCHPSLHQFDYVPRELYAISTPKEHGVLSVGIIAPTSIVDDEAATRLLDCLCAMIPRLAQYPDEMATRLIEQI